MTSTPDEIHRLKQEVNSLQQQAVGANAGEPIYIGDYLLKRLEQLNVTQMFGVPGDFNLGFLDLVDDNKKINWVGNCNELNASYAADGYARVNSKSIGVLLTTFGVGELSATNGIAGAFSEHVPILHIAGVPSTLQFKTKPMLHHTLGDGRYDAYEKAAMQFTSTQAHLSSKETAAAEIDRVLSACVTSAKPVYMTLPTDLVYEKIPSGRLTSVPLHVEPIQHDADTEAEVLDEIVKLVEEAKDEAIILVDACAVRHHVIDETRELAKKTGLPVYSTPMGKSAINEEEERFGGLYIGSLSHPQIKEKVEGAKLILSIGGLRSDFNTANFTYTIPTSRTVELHSDHTKVRYAMYPDIVMKRLLPKLTARLEHIHPVASKAVVPHFIRPATPDPRTTITHDWLWPRVGQFLRPKDVVVAETGTSAFGMLEVPLPKDVRFLAQILWGSIGWTTGATLGAALAARDLGYGRTILFIGDGSLQLTVQEISAMIRSGLNPILFVLNNSGYTIERFLHGKTRAYNDIQDWKWTELLSVFQGAGAGPARGKSYKVETKEELDRLMRDEAFAGARDIQLVEIIMDKFDGPIALKRQAELSGKFNKYVPTELDAE